MQSISNKWLRAAIFCLAVFMLWECVKPVLVLTILNNHLLLLLFIIVPMLLFYFRVPGWLNALAGVMLISNGIHFYFYRNEPIFSRSWILSATGEIYRNALLVWRGDLGKLSDLFSAFLFFVLLWLICFTLWHWLKTGRFYLLFFLAVASLSLVDTFTFYKTGPSIVIVILTGLLILGIQRFIEMRGNTPTNQRGQSFGYWTSIVVLAALLLFLGFSGPKPGPQWPSPIAFLQNKGLQGFNAGGSFFSAGQRIGYDSDDSNLGGSIGMDATVLFTAHVSGGSSYWRVASKDTYTGKGWASGGTNTIPLTQPSSESALTLYEGSTKVTEETASVSFFKASPPILPYVGQLTAISVPGGKLSLNQEAGQVLTKKEQPAKSEQISYFEPTFQVSALRKVTSGNDPIQIRNLDLQLPKELPNRVRTLAGHIMAGQGNRYDQVMAVVRYLKSSRFSYSTNRVPRPAKNQDYVDQFLFDSHVGYCDNFSTSMVVLLRSEGIPARWVKGFSSGTYMGESEDRVGGKRVLRSVYEIRNADAHSWVEVYFPGSGWVSFDPTPTFTDPGQFASAAQGNGKAASISTNKNAGQNASTGGGQNQQRQQQSQAKPPQSNNATRANQQQVKTKTGDVRRMSHRNGPEKPGWKFFPMIVCIVLAMAAILVFLTRIRWLTALYAKKQAKMVVKDKKSFMNAYANLFRLLGLNGLHRRKTQTLREFSEIVDHQFLGNDLSELTGYYERLAYSDQFTLSENEKIKIGNLIGHLVIKLADGRKK
ncbi:DUF4129 domain-containing transglutaminase family protein [Sporolactobacillus pectinivorans]|uniref:DUF4129 domain-containing transglutaminase family protein n=1 Tax=Sporolactobacillus pectinivorans TaxID=1591408 RepID=UPI000C25DD30|nr:transglutaminaseTgpA domain-containing protein [Sporolactobacillus pectinivorans]